MGPGFGPPPHHHGDNDKLKEPKPKNIKEVPHYLKNVISKLFYRLFYIVILVWEARPWILFTMVFMAIFNGVMPVIKAFVAADLLNSLAAAYISAVNGGESQFGNVVGLLILTFALMFITSLVHSIYNILNTIARERVSNHVNLKIMNKAKEIDLQSYDRPEFYEKLENASREAGSRPIQMMDAFFNIVSTLITMITFIITLWAISPFAPFIVIAMSIPSAIISFIYRKKNFLYMRHRSKDRRQMSYYSSLVTNKDMVKELRIFNLSDTFIGRYQTTFEKYFKGLKKLFIHEGYWNIGVSFITTVINCLLYVFIAGLVCSGNIEVGDYSLYTGALSSIAGGISTLISTTATIYEGTLFIDNMIVFMNEKKTVKSSLAQPVKALHHTGHTIVFDNVSFAYPGTTKNVIKNVNLTLNPGDTVVLVGLNGAGKTTLIKLLTRLYDPTEGTIYLDGRDIKEYDVEDLYKIYGIIFQDFGKYAVSVKENISFGNIEKEITDSELAEAAEKSNSTDFISKLPDKYDTPLMKYFEENGIEPSIGQWQKLSIARAFYSDSDILILDEPTASLDAIAEQEIYNQFDSLRKNKLTIFVSHRLSSATVASKIVVLNEGEIVELGTHAELMRAKGHYYKLFTTQASRYIAQDEDGNSIVFDGQVKADTSANDGQYPMDFDGNRPPMPPKDFDGKRPPMPPKDFDGKRPPMPPKDFDGKRPPMPPKGFDGKRPPMPPKDFDGKRPPMPPKGFDGKRPPMPPKDFEGEHTEETENQGR